MAKGGAEAGTFAPDRENLSLQFPVGPYMGAHEDENPEPLDRRKVSPLARRDAGEPIAEVAVLLVEAYQVHAERLHGGGECPLRDSRRTEAKQCQPDRNGQAAARVEQQADSRSVERAVRRNLGET